MKRPIPLVAGLSGSILCLEILYTRLFSALLYYHFTFVAVSMGMLGISAAALEVVLFFTKSSEAELQTKIFKSSLFFSVATLVSLVVVLGVPVFLSAQGMGSLICYYLACVLPLYFGGKALALIFTAQPQLFSRLYAVDFVAGAAGCLLVPLILVLYGAPGAILFVAVVQLGCLFLSLGAEEKKRKRIVVGFLLALLSVLALHSRFDLLRIYNPSMVGKKLVFEDWTAISRVGIYETATSPWLQENIFEPITVSDELLIIDARATTPIVPKAAFASVLQWKLDLSASAYVATERNRALIIGAGGGRDILIALKSGFKQIDAVEINPSIVKVMTSGIFADYSGNIYTQPGVHVHEMDGRRFIQESQEKYDNIQLTLVDTFASTAAGAFALSENNLYTLEAVEAYMDHLSPNGILAMSRWSGAESIRLFHLFREAAARRGISDIGRHLAVFASHLSPDSAPQAAFFLYSNSPFSEQSTQRLREFAKESRLPLYHDPLLASPSLISRIILEKNLITQQSLAGPFEQRASTDDWPFFFFRPQFDYWQHAITHPADLFSVPEYTVLGISFLSLVLSALILFLPLAFADRDATQVSVLRFLPFFGLIGLAFMFVELPWIQRSVLYLGHPTVAMVTVLVSLLFGCGIGALGVHRWGEKFPKGGLIASLLAAALLFLMEKSHGYLFAYTLAWPNYQRILFAGFFFLPLGLILGTLLPLGMKKISSRPRRLTAWAWAINGCASVVGSSGAMLTALFLGFHAALMVGIGLYLLAAFAFYWSFLWRPLSR